MKWDRYGLTDSQWKIANYVQKHLQQVLLSTEKEIAQEIGVSIATVSRFWQAIGYKNLKEFKKEMKDKWEVSPAGKMKNVSKQSPNKSMYVTIEKSLGLLQETLEHLDENQFLQAIDLLHKAKSIHVLALGPSKGLGELLTYRIARFGKHIQTFQKQGHELFEEMIHLTEKDVLIIFAFGRLLPEAKVLLSYQRQKHYHSILITDQLVADFSSLSTITLYASRGEANEFHSMIAPTLLIENLILKLGMKEEEKNIERLETLSRLRKQFSEELPR